MEIKYKYLKIFTGLNLSCFLFFKNIESIMRNGIKSFTNKSLLLDLFFVISLPDNLIFKRSNSLKYAFYLLIGIAQGIHCQYLCSY